MKFLKTRTILTLTATLFMGFQSYAEPALTSECELIGEATQTRGEIGNVDSLALKTEMNSIRGLQLFDVKDGLSGEILEEDAKNKMISFKPSKSLIMTFQSSGPKAFSMVQTTSAFTLPKSESDSSLPINSFAQMESGAFLIAYDIGATVDGKSVNLFITERKSTNGSTSKRKMKFALSKNGQTIEKELKCEGVKFTY